MTLDNRTRILMHHHSLRAEVGHLRHLAIQTVSLSPEEIPVDSPLAQPSEEDIKVLTEILSWEPDEGQSSSGTGHSRRDRREAREAWEKEARRIHEEVEQAKPLVDLSLNEPLPMEVNHTFFENLKSDIAEALDSSDQ